MHQTDAVRPNTAQIKSYPLKFTGTGGQYFRVWLVNVILTLLTLGIYTPWARKRTAEYFFGHSVIGRSPLEFAASLKRMVIGFFVFLALYFVFRRALNSTSLLTVSLALLSVAGAIPFFWGSSRRFRTTATRWRGLRLRFGTSWKEIYWASWPVFLAAALWILVYMGIDMIRTFTSPSLLEEFQPTTWWGVRPGIWILLTLGLVCSWLCVVRLLFNYQRLSVELTYIGIERGVMRATYWDFLKIWFVTSALVVAGWAGLGIGLPYLVLGGQDGSIWQEVRAEMAKEEARQAEFEQSSGDFQLPEGWEEMNQEELMEHVQAHYAEQERLAASDEPSARGSYSRDQEEPSADQPERSKQMRDWFVSVAVVMVVILATYLTIWQLAMAYREAKQHRVVWNSVGVSDIARFRCNLSVGRFMWLRLQNWILTIVTLGFFRPFARVREYRAKWDSTTVLIKGGVSQLKSLLVIQQESGAFADAVADFAGFDIVT